MDDERFSVTTLSQEVGYSQIQFSRKIKALSGQTPNHFLRTIRLKRAADLLRSNSDHIAQIAFSVGFRSESYFIKCFKDQYGVTPGEFSQQGNLTSIDE
jgi:transcriptional regulator GlxA family with amidase domain